MTKWHTNRVKMTHKLIRDDWSLGFYRLICGTWCWTLIAMGIGRDNIEGDKFFDSQNEAREDALAYMEKHNLKKYEPTSTTLSSGSDSNH